MVKKVFDILPPKEPTTFREEKQLLIGKKVSPPKEIREKEAEVVPKISLNKNFLLVAFIFILIIGGFLVSFKFSKAEIKIWPETETVTFRTKLTVDKVIKESNFTNRVIPGEIFEVEKTITQEFSSSGRLLKKAQGTIRLYNAFTTAPENWLAQTRFVSSDGKLFLSKDRISVPGAEMKNGKIVPTFVDVPVIAAEAGGDYNIGPSHFSIIAFKGTPRYTKFYGESLESMTGGGEASQVAKEDLEGAEKILTEKAKAELNEALKSKIPDGYLFLEDATETKILDKFSLVKVGEEIEKFNFQVRAKSTTISFKKEFAENFAREFITSQIPQGKLLYSESLKIEYTVDSLNLESGKLSLSLNIAAKTYPELDSISLKKGLAGKSLTEAKIFLENQPKIIKTEIRFFPFWIKSVPDNLEKIELKYPIIAP